MQESFTIDAWLNSVLGGDPTLASLVSGVYGELAPQGAVTPYIVTSWLAAPDTLTANGIFVFTQALVHIRAIIQNTSDLTLQPITSQINLLLHRQRGTTVYGVVLGVVREQVTKRTFVEQDVLFRERGGIYRFYAQGG